MDNIFLRNNILEKFKNLKSTLNHYNSVVVAFSGGVDSTFLLKVAVDVLGKNVAAVTLKSLSFPEREFERAVKIAKEFKAKHYTIFLNELENPDFVKNDFQRCYYCKIEGFSKIIKFAKENGFLNVIDGQNFDDILDYRPGANAALKLGVKSPLKEAGLTKNDIRCLSKMLRIKDWDRPSFACLASRIPYGTKITDNLLRKIDHLEQLLIGLGFNQVRVRHHDKIARIEMPSKDFQL